MSKPINPNEVPVSAPKNYSGHNRIPNIKQFVESLDKDKRERDAKIEREQQQRVQAGGESVQHPPAARKVGKNRRTVRDPVTGRDVEIDDADDSILKQGENPMVCCPFSPYLSDRLL
jgi:hypothetical protein